jgi:hypothetical protein
MTVCTATDLPVPWNVRTARDNESIHALPLIDKARQRGFAVETRGDQVALPDRRVPAQIQGRPAAPADAARDGPLVIALPSPRLRRARVWSPQDRRDLRRCVSGRVEQVRLHADLTILAKLSCALNGRAPYP